MSAIDDLKFWVDMGMLVFAFSIPIWLYTLHNVVTLIDTIERHHKWEWFYLFALTASLIYITHSIAAMGVEIIYGLTHLRDFEHPTYIL